MAEPRKNHLDIDGAVVKEDEHIATYKPIPESDTELRSSKGHLAKSKEKLSADGAEEKLLQKEVEAKITTRVDMADAKYVVGDHRNGDAKIELDANKKQFSGLTKEELMKYADDPFWVRLRWFMFILFWALWLSMLVGAVVIIVRAPKCTVVEKKWYEKGPVLELSAEDTANLDQTVSVLNSVHAQAIFLNGDVHGNAYSVLEDDTALNTVKSFIEKTHGAFRVIIDLTANYVPVSHKWFELSANRSAEYDNFFIWADGGDYTDAEKPELPQKQQPPNTWVSKYNKSAWAKHDGRKQFYLAQIREGHADLNFTNLAVVDKFDQVVRKWMGVGVAGIRLREARHLLIGDITREENARGVNGADHTEYAYWTHKHSSDQPGLDDIINHWAYIADENALNDAKKNNTVFTLFESERPELFVVRQALNLRPPSVVPLDIDQPTEEVVKRLRNVANMPQWPALQLVSTAPGLEVAALSMLLPAAPVLSVSQVGARPDNSSEVKLLKDILFLRNDSTIHRGNVSVSSINASATDLQVLALARWQTHHAGYAALWNAHGEPLNVDVSRVTSLPDDVKLLYASEHSLQYTNYTINKVLKSVDILVPPKSTLVFSYAPDTATKQ